MKNLCNIYGSTTLAIMTPSIKAKSNIKNFFVRNLLFFVMSKSGRGYHSQVPHLGQSPSINNKHYTRLEKLVKNRHTSLLRKFINQGQKGFITLAQVQHRVTQSATFLLLCCVSRGRIFSCVRPFYERALSDLYRSLHRSLQV